MKSVSEFLVYQPTNLNILMKSSYRSIFKSKSLNINIFLKLKEEIIISLNNP